MNPPLVYFVANESVAGGLLRAQLLQPLAGSGLAGQVKVINIIHPLGKVLDDLPQVRTLKCGIPARFYLFKLGGLLDLLAAAYYGVALCFVVAKGSRVVARSYFSALAVLALSKLKPVELVFDTRSQFVQENLSAGKLVRGSAAHRRWLGIEARLLNFATKVLAVSEAQAAYYRQVAPAARVEVIPCFGQPDYALLTASSRAQARQRMGFAPDDVVVCYYGSLDQKWNHIQVYADFFAECLRQGTKICVITPSAKALLKDPRLAVASAFITQIDDPLEARRLMSACDHGVIIMKKSDDWESRLGVKFVEYLSAGLQVMVGEWVGAAAAVAREHFADSTTVISWDDPRPPAELSQLPDDRRQEIARKAESLFGYHRMREVFDMPTAAARNA